MVRKGVKKTIGGTREGKEKQQVEGGGASGAEEFEGSGTSF